LLTRQSPIDRLATVRAGGCRDLGLRHDFGIEDDAKPYRARPATPVPLVAAGRPASRGRREEVPATHDLLVRNGDPIGRGNVSLI